MVLPFFPFPSVYDHEVLRPFHVKFLFPFPGISWPENVIFPSLPMPILPEWDDDHDHELPGTSFPFIVIFPLSMLIRPPSVPLLLLLSILTVVTELLPPDPELGLVGELGEEFDEEPEEGLDGTTGEGINEEPADPFPDVEDDDHEADWPDVPVPDDHVIELPFPKFIFPLPLPGFLFPFTFAFPLSTLTPLPPLPDEDEMSVDDEPWENDPDEEVDDEP